MIVDHHHRVAAVGQGRHDVAATSRLRNISHLQSRPLLPLAIEQDEEQSHSINVYRSRRGRQSSVADDIKELADENNNAGT